MTVSDRYVAVPERPYRYPGSQATFIAMDGAAVDPDLIEFTYWSREVRGLAENTTRVRFDLLVRLHTYVGIPLRDIRPGHLLAFERLAIAGRATETRRAYACHIRAFYRWAVQTGVITSDPSTMLTVPRVPRRLPRPIAEDDLRFALTAARPKMRAVLTLAAYAGLRSVEIAGLDWTDLRRDETGSYLHVRHGKGAKERTVEIGTTVIRALQAYGVRRRGAMFLGLNGARADARSISRSGNRYLAAHGIHATMHQLRHRFGTIAYQVSQDLRMVQEQMGHASPTTTAGYTRPSPDAAKRMVRALDELAHP